MSLGSQVVRGGLVFFAGRNAFLVSNVLRSVVLARLLVPEQFGVVALSTSLALLYRRFNAFSFPTAAIRYQGDEQALFATQFLVEEVLELVGFFILLLTQPLIRAVYGTEVGNIVLVIGVLLLLASTNSMPITALEKRMAFRTVAAIDIAKSVIGFALPVTMAWWGMGIWSLVAAFGTEHVVTNMALWIILRPQCPSLRFDRSIAKYLFGFGMFMWITEQLAVLTTQYDKIILGSLAGAATLGTYNLAATVVAYPFTFLQDPLEKVIYPWYARVQGVTDQMNRAFALSVTFSVNGSLLAAVMLFAAAPQLILLVYGEKWMASVPLLRGLVVFGVLRQMINLVRPVLLSVGQQKQYTSVIGIQAGAMAILCPLFTSLGGALGTVASLVIASAVGVVVSYHYALKVVRLPISRVSTSLFSAALSLIVWWTVSTTLGPIPPLLGLVLAMTVTSGSYLAILAALDGQRLLEEGRLLWSVVKPSIAS